EDAIDLVDLLDKSCLGTGQQVGGVLLLRQALCFTVGGFLRKSIDGCTAHDAGNLCTSHAVGVDRDKEARALAAREGNAAAKRHEYVGRACHLHVIATGRLKRRAHLVGDCKDNILLVKSYPWRARVWSAVARVDDDDRLGVCPPLGAAILGTLRLGLAWCR